MHAVLALVPDYDVLLVSERAITIRRKSDDMNLQIILKTYDSPDAILHSFDLPACKVLLTATRDGTAKGLEAWCTESFLFSVAHQVLWLDPGRFNAMYALRLCKYRLKGFRVVLLGVSREKRHVDPAVHGRELATSVTVAFALDLEKDVCDALASECCKTPLTRAYDVLMAHTSSLRTRTIYDVFERIQNPEGDGETAVYSYTLATSRALAAVPSEFAWK